MSLRELALKAGELRSLDRGGLVVLALRCALRVEPWRPKEAIALWGTALETAWHNGFSDSPVPVTALHRELNELGVHACNRLLKSDEPLGRCYNYAVQAMITALAASAHLERARVLADTRLAAKMGAAIPAVWAHAGRVEGADAVDRVCAHVWTEIRADIPLIASAPPDIAALRVLRPFWTGPSPIWAKP